MKPVRLKTLWHGIATLCLMTTLALGAPVYNATNQAPRSVFLTLPATEPAPTVALSLEQSGADWLLILQTTGFEFTAFCMPTAKAAPIGHAHVTINGVKAGSAYLPLFDLGSLGPGVYQITATLRAQDHRALLGQQGLIASTLTLTISPEGRGQIS